jgi:2,4-dienoyl-CoA reductase (NADPH2)
VGARPENSLEAVLKEKKISYSVAGDAENIGMAFDAVHKGYAAGKAIE